MLLQSHAHALRQAGLMIGVLILVTFVLALLLLKAGAFAGGHLEVNRFGTILVFEIWSVATKESPSGVAALMIPLGMRRLHQRWTK